MSPGRLFHVEGLGFGLRQSYNNCMSVARSHRPFEPARVDLPKLFDKQPPHALEAECALLGAMILDPQVVGEIVQLMGGPDDFYKPAHSAIYKVLVDLYDQNQPIDAVQIKQRLADLGQLEQVGGIEYVISLVDAVPSAVSAPYYAKIVREKAVLRKLIEASTDILTQAYTSAEPVGNLLDKAEQSIFRLAEGRASNEASELRVLLQETYERLESHDGRTITGISTGFYDLDEMTSGFQPGELIILAARPSMGKTAFALNIAENMAANDKVPVAVFSLEMGKQQLAQRLLCSRSGVDSQKLRRNMLSSEDFAQLARTVGELSEAPIYIDDTPGLTLLALRAKARRLCARYDVKVIFIDYLQLMSSPGADSRQQEVSNISRGVKELARELSVPVVCLSQLNRASEQREGHRPRMSDLRESGSIEQDADVIMMLHREDYYHRGEEDYVNTNTAEAIIVKQRNGPTDTVKLAFHGGTTRFHNLSHARPPGDMV
jgi:replicative DNA helicase